MHLPLIKFWPPRAPWKGVCGGAKIFGSALLQRSAQCLRLSERFFHFRMRDVRRICQAALSSRTHVARRLVHHYTHQTTSLFSSDWHDLALFSTNGTDRRPPQTFPSLRRLIRKFDSCVSNDACVQDSPKIGELGFAL